MNCAVFGQIGTGGLGERPSPATGKRPPSEIPADVPGKDEAAKITNYAADLDHYIERTFPTAVIAHRPW